MSRGGTPVPYEPEAPDQALGLRSFPEARNIRRVAIVGHEAAKFTPVTERAARRLIRELIAGPEVLVVSGACPLGGVDIYAVEEARALGLPYREHPPKTRAWSSGYKPRNLLIAGDCEEAHCIVVRDLPPDYAGEFMFADCYHCQDLRPRHVKSGGCWTVMRAKERGARVHWHIITPDGKVHT